MNNLLAKLDRYNRLAPVLRFIRSIGRLKCLHSHLKAIQISAVSTPKVLVLGVYLADRRNFAEHLIERFDQAKNLDVQQAWAVMRTNEIPSNLRKHTKLIFSTGKPKFIAINDLISLYDISTFDFIIVCDDDIVIPNNFLDTFISSQIFCNFAIAQPARTSTSCGSKTITIAQAGTFARQTRFVEIGPLFSVSRNMFSKIFPFDEKNTMGWGTDYHWPVLVEQENFKMGIIDSTPVDHSIRGLASAYSSTKAIDDMTEYLQRKPHLSEAESQVTLMIINAPTA